MPPAMAQPGARRRGQLSTGSYMDYAMARADDAPLFANGSHPVPARTTSGHRGLR